MTRRLSVNQPGSAETAATAVANSDLRKALRKAVRGGARPRAESWDWDTNNKSGNNRMCFLNI